MKKIAIVLLLLTVFLLSGCIESRNGCGNGICEAGENFENCPIYDMGDCPPIKDPKDQIEPVDPVEPRDDELEAISIDLSLYLTKEGDVSVYKMQAVSYEGETGFVETESNCTDCFAILHTVNGSEELHLFRPELVLYANPPIYLDETIYTVQLPFEGSEKIEVLFEGETKLSLDTQTLLCNGDLGCQEYENYLSCPSDCSTLD